MKVWKITILYEIFQPPTEYTMIEVYGVMSLEPREYQERTI